MICGSHLFKNTKTEMFVLNARKKKIIVAKLKRQNRPDCYILFNNSKIFSFLSSKPRF